jgi:2-hydroxychromene-2-carboxylate isomerase
VHREPPVSVPAAFYFDLRSPRAYLAAERALHVLPAPCEWQPVLSRLLPRADSFEVYRCEPELLAMREDVERRAAALALQPLRWPAPFPFDSDLAMLTATYARRIGKTVAFALAAFRQAYAGGRALSVPDNVLIAAAACEMHPAAVLKATRSRALRAELEGASVLAAALGVEDVPAVRVGDRIVAGEAALEQAGLLLAEARA